MLGCEREPPCGFWPCRIRDGRGTPLVSPSFSASEAVDVVAAAADIVAAADVVVVLLLRC